MGNSTGDTELLFKAQLRYSCCLWTPTYFFLDYNDSEPDQPCYSSPSMPCGFEYLPTRVEDREDVDDFIESSVLGASRNRDIIVDYIRHEKFTRPTYNLARNAGNIDGNDSNLLFYTVI